MTLIKNENVNYITTVEQYILSKTRTNCFLSPDDYEHIRSWDECKIPVETVFHIIDNASAFNIISSKGRLNFKKITQLFKQELSQK